MTTGSRSITKQRDCRVVPPSAVLLAMTKKESAYHRTPRNDKGKGIASSLTPFAPRNDKRKGIASSVASLLPRNDRREESLLPRNVRRGKALAMTGEGKPSQ